MTTAIVTAALIGVCIGVKLGQSAMASSLTLRADCSPRDRTPFFLQGRPYYVVPEHEYVQSSLNNLLELEDW